MTVKDINKLKEFVNNNFKFLLSKNFDLKEFKHIRKIFFINTHNKKFGIPTNIQIAELLIEKLTKVGKNSDSIKNIIDQCRFFGYLSDSDKERISRKIEKNKNNVLSSEDIELIRSHNKIEALEKIKGKELEEKKEKELEQLNIKIEQKQELLNDLESILDHPDEIVEPDYDPEIENFKEWWERFYLKSNPFKQGPGLTNISKDLYEDIIVKTLPFKKTFSRLKKEPTFLFHTSSFLLGNFRSGKTTFFDYLSHILIMKYSILPIIITSTKNFIDSAGYIDHFLIQLKNEFKNNIGILKKEFDDLDIENQIISLGKEILKKYKGILIFLDDYHKHESYFEQVFEFLGKLQIVKDRFYRNGLNVGFIVAGLINWNDELNTNTKMQGFLDNNSIFMPEITPEIICEMFNKRIKAFSYDQNPRQIKIDFIKHLFDKEKDRASYTHYINKIVSELSNNNTAIVNSPIQVSDADLKKIEDIINSNSSLKTSFNKLTKESRFKKFTKEQIDKCLEILVQISLYQGISEDDKLFTENNFYFLRLKESKLIEKNKIPNTNDFEWKICKRLQKVIKIIKEDFNLTISDYLLKIYTNIDYDTIISEQTEIEDSKIKNILDFFNKNKDRIEKSTLKHLELAFRLNEAVKLRHTGSKEELNFNNAIDSIDRLSAVLFELDNTNLLFRKASISKLEEKWELHWYDDESIYNFFKCINDYQKNPTDIKYNIVIRQSIDIFKIIADLVYDIGKDFFNYSQPTAYFNNVINFRKEEIEIYKKVKEFYYSAKQSSHYSYIEKITNYLEEQFRTFLYISCYLTFGKEYPNKIPTNIIKYSHRNLSERECNSIINNFFNGLTRPQFREIFINKNDIQKNIIKAIKLRWTNDDWNLFFNIFCEENIFTSHKQKQAYSPTERDKYIRYFNMAKELLTELNKFIKNIVNKNIFIIYAFEDDSNFDDFIFRFKFYFNTETEKLIPSSRKINIEDKNKLTLDLDKVNDFSVKKDIFEKVNKTIIQKVNSKNTKYLIEDIMDVEFICRHYNVNYADFICSIAYGQYILKIYKIYPWFGSSIIIKYLK